MKLVELLVKELEEWPEEVTYFVQDDDGCVKAGSGSELSEPDISGIWFRCITLDNYSFSSDLCTDWQTSIVTKDVYTKHKPVELWQYGCTIDDKEVWFDLDCYLPMDCGLKFRRKPKTHIIHGVEIPDLRITPEPDQHYWYPDPCEEELVCRILRRLWSSSDNYRIANNLCYEYSEEGKQAAILHAKVMLGIA